MHPNRLLGKAFMMTFSGANTCTQLAQCCDLVVPYVFAKIKTLHCQLDLHKYTRQNKRTRKYLSFESQQKLAKWHKNYILSNKIRESGPIPSLLLNYQGASRSGIVIVH